MRTYNRSSEADQAAYDCGDDLFLEYAICLNAIEGCDTEALGDCTLSSADFNSCPDGAIDVTGCPDVEASFE